ncbi:suppressor of fused domain protein [Ralstonia nicotianae]|uniref:suppressor of fused domain protein n=1 Tax=Ralstonia solanacearum species complex TaxID=3116862 RepID=UPI002005CD71|nr:suppressor of fused domain protein [Ralstonia pseudosolanacearum]
MRIEMSGVSDINKKIARHIASKFGGSPKVTRYWSDDQAISVDLLAAAGGPCSGVMSYGTIGLSDHPVRINDDGDEVCVELLGACADAVKNFPNALTTAAFYAIRNQWHCVHGGVLQNALDMYKLSVTMKHFLFTSPFLWEGFNGVDFGDKKVHWLLAVPISDAEHAYLRDHGLDALERAFEDRQIDIFDINRDSVF